MASTRNAFISYSRKDYYFAESLAFQLMERGVAAWLDSKDLEPGADWTRNIEAAIDAAPCLIFVVSPESLKSETVRRELQRAHSQSKRIIAVLFRKQTIPAEWGIAEAVDFRGAFEPALEELITRLASAPASTDAIEKSGQTSPAFRLPPWVTASALLLGWPFMIPIMIPFVYPEYFTDLFDSVRSWDINRQNLISAFAGRGYDPFVWGLFFISIVLIFRYAFVDFLCRRMSMTRLTVVFVFVMYSSGYPLAQHFLGSAIPELAAGPVMRGLRSEWPLSFFIFISALTSSSAGLGIVLFKRPGDLLRWTPTGHAWRSYRLEHAPNAATVTDDTAFSLKLIERFQLVHDVRDAPMAERLRQVLRVAGATETPDDSEDVTKVLLLTNCNRCDWIERQALRVPGRLLTLLGTNVSVPNSLDWLWRIHWVDFRNWDASRIAHRQDGLPLIPEAHSRPLFPALVSRAHHLLCTLSALLFHAFYTGQSQAPTGMTLLDTMGYATTTLFPFFVPFFWMIPARRLVKRKCPAASFFRAVAVCFIVTVVAAFWKLHEFPIREVKEAFVATIFVIVVPAWLLRQRRELAFWFPLPAAHREKNSPSLAPARNWLTLVWFAVYWFVWAQIFRQGEFA